MQVAVNEARPPYVTFETQPVEDRAASEAAGHFVAKDVIFAIITPAGSKDRIPMEAEPWLKQLEQEVREERFPKEWLPHYKEAYRAFKAGQEIPLNGTPIRTWPVLSPAQIAHLLLLNVRTVEDLAVANEQTLTAIGMGGRDLKQRAVDWIAAAAGPGKINQELSNLRVKLEGLETNLKGVMERNAQLELENKALKSLDSTAKEALPQPTAGISATSELAELLSDDPGPVISKL